MGASRIAIVRARYSPHGGAEKFVANALKALHSDGVSVTLITRKWPERDSGTTLTCNPFYIGNVWRDWGFSKAVCSLLTRERFDLVQSHERIPCCDIYRAGDGVHREWLRQRTQNWSPFKRAMLAFNPYHTYVRYAENKVFRSDKLKAVICNSTMVKNEIQKWFQTPVEKLHVIYSGVDTKKFHPSLRKLSEPFRAEHQIPSAAPVYLYVGSGFERKGVAALLEAFANLPDAAHLLIVGKDKRQTVFERMALTLGLSKRVHFMGAVADVKPCYGAADVFVLPTLYDPFPNVILEAMASGLPVISSTKSGGAELVCDGINGFVCDARDTKALSDRMKVLLTPEIRRSAGIAARETAAQFTLEAMSQRLGKLYQALLSSEPAV